MNTAAQFTKDEHAEITKEENTSQWHKQQMNTAAQFTWLQNGCAIENDGGATDEYGCAFENDGGPISGEFQTTGITVAHH